MDTTNETRAVDSAQAEPERIEFDDYASYEEDDSLVICDRTDAAAWVKSDVLVEIRR